MELHSFFLDKITYRILQVIKFTTYSWRFEIIMLFQEIWRKIIWNIKDTKKSQDFTLDLYYSRHSNKSCNKTSKFRTFSNFQIKLVGRFNKFKFIWHIQMRKIILKAKIQTKSKKLEEASCMCQTLASNSTCYMISSLVTKIFSRYIHTNGSYRNP